MVAGYFRSSAFRRATLREMRPISRSRLRTPASNVYSRIMRCRARGLEGQADVGDAVLFDLAWDQITVGNLELLLLDVAGELDDLHAIQQGRRNRAEVIGGGHEHDLREIERQLEVMIAEGVVLLRIEHLQHGRSRIAAEIGVELVDLVEHEERIGRAGALHGLEDAAGQRADIRAAMAADLGLVADATQRNAHELAAERLSDGATQRGLAGAGRSDEAQDRLAFLAWASASARRYIRGCAPWLSSARSDRARGLVAACLTSRLSGVEVFHGRSMIQSI